VATEAKDKDAASTASVVRLLRLLTARAVLIARLLQSLHRHVTYYAVDQDMSNNNRDYCIQIF